jgi:hypothetical protein
MSRHRVASVAAATYQPSEKFRALPDFTPFAVIAEKIHSRIMSELAASDLTARRRELFCHFGAGEGFLLDRVKPNCRNQYFATRFQIEALFPSWVREP